MPLLAKNKGQDFDPIPAGTHEAICYGVIDLGMQPSQKFKPSHKVLFIWELPGERIDLERDGKKVNLPRAISARFTLSLSEKSNLRPMLESWRGRGFTPQELEGFDLKNVVGANCLLSVIHTTKEDGKKFADVASVSPLLKGMQKRTPENPPIYYSIDDQPTGPLTFPANMPEWVQETIKQSEEYKQRAGITQHVHETDERERYGDARGETAEPGEKLPF